MKAVVAAFNEEKALVGAFSVITNLRIDLRFNALVDTVDTLDTHQTMFNDTFELNNFPSCN